MAFGCELLSGKYIGDQIMLQPNSVILDASTLCQLNCVLCSTANKSIYDLIGAGTLSLDNFERFVNNNPEIKYIDLANRGEVFLNKNIIGILQHAKKKNVELSISGGSNMNAMTDEICEAVVKYGLADLSCSLDGITQETYRIYRRNGNINKALSAVELINKYKKQYDSTAPIMTWQYILFGHNEHEIEAAKAKAKELDMLFATKLNWDTSFSPVSKEMAMKHYGAVDRAEVIASRGHVYNFCLQLWNRPAINWDGRLFGCCANVYGDFGVNVFDVGLRKALMSERISTAKKMLLGKIGPDASTPCAGCATYKRMQSTGNYIKYNHIALDRMRLSRAAKMARKNKTILSLYRRFRKMINGM